MAGPKTALQLEAEAARQLLEALRQAGLDDEETQELSIASETGLTEAVREVLDAEVEARSHIVALTRRETLLAARRERLEHKALRLRLAIQAAMESVGLTRLRLPEASLALQVRQPAVKIIDEAAIPPAYIREKITTSIDKAAIARAIKSGQPVPGAHLENMRPSLTVRTA